MCAQTAIKIIALKPHRKGLTRHSVYKLSTLCRALKPQFAQAVTKLPHRQPHGLCGTRLVAAMRAQGKL